jgi:hypothetical protein
MDLREPIIAIIALITASITYIKIEGSFFHRINRAITIGFVVVGILVIIGFIWGPYGPS